MGGGNDIERVKMERHGMEWQGVEGTNWDAMGRDGTGSGWDVSEPTNLSPKQEWEIGNRAWFEWD